MAEQYTAAEKMALLRIARQAIKAATEGQSPAVAGLDDYSPALQGERACFVTLHTRSGRLRGCTGTLTARQPLAREVEYIAAQTALHDPRFNPVQPDEVQDLVIEISVLTPAVPLSFSRPRELPSRLRPQIDGVVLIIGQRRGTFLPQVWERVPDPEDFLNLLCHKMGLPSGAWQQDNVTVCTYQTIVFEEESSPV